MGTHSRARRGLRALVVSSVMTVALVASTAINVGAETNAQKAQRGAQRGAQWLANQIRANGGVLKNFGQADVTDTAYAVIGMRAAGVDKGASNRAIAYLKTKIGAKIQAGGQDSSGGLAEYIMAAVSNGGDPRKFGGNGPNNNLVRRLLNTQHTTGADKGLFGAQDPTYDGAFRQGLALGALAAVHIPKTDTRIANAISWLANQQCSDGLWQSYRADTSVACDPADPNLFTGPDTNSTGWAVQGLAAWGVHPNDAGTLSALDAVQSSDAGFPYIAAAGQPSDPNSTALVIQAINAAGSAPSAGMWVKTNQTPVTALLKYQLGCKSQGFGAFTFPGSPGPNIFATVQAVPALTGKTLPLKPSTKSTTLTLRHC
jgi:hypothetical protein